LHDQALCSAKGDEALNKTPLFGRIFGNVSKQSLAEQVAGQSVVVEWVKVDKYGRKLGKVLLGGLDSNLVQVKRGLAWHYKQYQREQSPNDRKLYEAAEDSAKAGRRGLWRDTDPVPPWEFRHTKTKG
jgi:endonuclease YncB( thermonuclease family)